MTTHRLSSCYLLAVVLVSLALAPLGSQTVEELCSDPVGKTEGARVRIAWTELETAFQDVRIAYCVLRGDADAKLDFERDAEIVYFALATGEKKADRRAYTFVIRTSAGRTVRQGPAVLQPLARQPLSCRVDVCQFFTEPGERVVSVAVQTNEQRHR